MKIRYKIVLALIVISFGLIGCGGSNNLNSSNSNIDNSAKSNESNSSHTTQKSLSFWSITKENRFQTFSAFAVAIDITSVFKFSDLKIEEFSNADCYVATESSITFNNCKIEKRYQNIYYNGRLNRLQENNKSFIANNFSIEIEDIGMVTVSSGKIVFDELSNRYGYYNIFLEAHDFKGNSVKWKDVTVYKTADEILTIKGNISTSIIDNRWLILESSKNFKPNPKNEDTADGTFYIKGDSSSLKFDFSEDGVAIYVNDQLLEISSNKDIQDRYDKRDQYLKE